MATVVFHELGNNAGIEHDRLEIPTPYRSMNSALVDWLGLMGQKPVPNQPPTEVGKRVYHVNECTVAVFYGHGLRTYDSPTRINPSLPKEKKELADVPYEITNAPCSAAEIFGCNTGRYTKIEKPVDGAECPMEDVIANVAAHYQRLMTRARAQAKKICGECCGECGQVTIFLKIHCHLVNDFLE